MKLSGDELLISLGDRRWRVRGLSKTTTFDSLRVNLLVGRADAADGVLGGRFNVDTLDSIEQAVGGMDQGGVGLVGIQENLHERDQAMASHQATSAAVTA